MPNLVIKSETNINKVDYELLISYQQYLLASGDWILRSRRLSNENGCSDKDMLKGKMKLETLGVCEDFCKDTRFLQYHESTYCGCFSECDFKRPANEYNSKADVYEQQNFGMISSRNIHN